MGFVLWQTVESIFIMWKITGDVLDMPAAEIWSVIHSRMNAGLMAR